MNVLGVSGLGKRSGRSVLLDDVSFAVASGTTLVVLGPSGSGKTSLLRLLLGVDAPSTGTIKWRGALLADAGRVVVAPEARKFGMVFQDAALFPHLTVLGNVEFGLQALAREQRRERAKAWLDKLGVAALAGRRIDVLSGGERQRVALARALACGPELLLLDEPFSSVDRIVRRELVAVLVQLVRESSTTMVFVTHDARDALDLGTAVLLLERGRVARFGPLAEVRKDPGSVWAGEFMASGLGGNA